MNETTINFKLQEPSHVDALLPGFGIEWWMIPATAAILLGLAAILLLLRRKKKRAAGHPVRHREIAYKTAKENLSRIDVATSREAAVRCSLILRKYLATAANDPALFETHEEFVTRQDSLATLTNEAKDASAHGFAHLAALKYAPQEPAAIATPAAVIQESQAMLETLHHGFRP